MQKREKRKAAITDRLIESSKPEEKLYRIWDTKITGFFIKVRPSGVVTYGLYYRHDEKLKEYTIGKHGALTAKQARDEAKELAGEAAKGADVQAQKVSARRETEAARLRTLKVFIDEKYGPWVTVERKTGADTLKRIAFHFDFLANKPMSEITEWSIVKWRTGRIKEGVSPKTVNRDITALKGVLSKAVAWGTLQENPLAGLKPMKVDNHGKQRFLSPGEEQALRAGIDAREDDIKQGRESGNVWREARGYEKYATYDANQHADHIKPMLLLLLNTGLRPAELFQLEWPDISLKGKLLTVRGEISKSGKTRHIPLNREAQGVLLQWRNQQAGNGLVFPSPVNGGAMVKIPKAVYRVFARAKLKDFRPYDLRHTFASKLVMAGADLNTVRELLGHRDISTTLIYAHLAPDHKAAAVELLNDM